MIQNKFATVNFLKEYVDLFSLHVTPVVMFPILSEELHIIYFKENILNYQIPIEGKKIEYLGIIATLKDHSALHLYGKADFDVESH